MTSGRIKRSFSKSAVIAAGEYARCRQLVFMPRIKFPFFFFPPVAGSIISGARGALFSSDAILAFLIALRSLPSLSLYLSLSVSLSLSAHRRAAFSRSFVSFIYIYIKRNILPRCLHFERSSFYDVRLQTFVRLFGDFQALFPRVVLDGRSSANVQEEGEGKTIVQRR